MTITLHQFPISHYCEKVRWALDYKGVPYRINNLLPGRHIGFVKRVAPRTHVPVLEAEGEFIQGSAAIIDWLDARFEEHPLTPAEPSLAQEAREWERFADEELGPHVRRWSYYTLLDHPRLVLPLITTGAPALSKPLFRLFFPKVRQLMRKTMRINPREAQLSATVLEESLERMQRRLADRRFLAGEQFTRADLAVASLLAPFFMPPEYGVNWPRSVPEPLQGWVTAHRQYLEWPQRIYQEYR